MSHAKFLGFSAALVLALAAAFAEDGIVAQGGGAGSEQPAACIPEGVRTFSSGTNPFHKWSYWRWNSKRFFRAKVVTSAN